MEGWCGFSVAAVQAFNISWTYTPFGLVNSLQLLQ